MLRACCRGARTPEKTAAQLTLAGAELARLHRMDASIDHLQRMAAADAAVIPLGGGLPAESTFPTRELASAFTRALAADRGALQYGWPEGRVGLRRWIAAWLGRRGANVAASDVIITSGAQQAISIALQSLCRRGDVVATSERTYPGAIDLFRMRGLACSTSAASPRASYVMPAIGNPTGRSMSQEARCALVAIDAPILEDDAYADLRFDGAWVAPLLASYPENVWHIGTFSKSVCPGLRVGWLVPPADKRARALSVKHASDLQANTMAQAILEAYLAAGDFEERLVLLRAEYATRAEILMRALRRHLPQLQFEEPEGGFTLYAHAHESLDEESLLARAIEHGTSFDPGRQFAFRAGPMRLAEAGTSLRLSFSSARMGDLEEGVKRLAHAWRDARKAPRRVPMPAYARFTAGTEPQFGAGTRARST